MAGNLRTITLLTDFGMRDHFVAAMKGVMLGLNPDLRFVDITHLIPPHDVQSAAFTLAQAVSCFPPDTIHLAVVDPGVGTARKALVATHRGQYFVAPDNGILTQVFAGEEGIVVHEITADHYFRKPVSSTFHGRDIFAPVAAWLSRDIPLHQFGPALRNPVRLKIPALTRVRDTLIQAAILAVDHFGNLVTNLRAEDLPVYNAAGGRSCKILAAQREITTFRRTFGEGTPGDIFVVPGSTGYLEIVMRDGSAAEALKLGSGAVIGVVLS
jgi:S-adenosyl-L-methionine hydrolase (adenosine-forming)